MPEQRTGSRSSELTVETWTDRWLEPYARPSVKPSTYCSYEMLVRVHVKPILGDIPFLRLDSITLQEFFDQKHSSRKTTGVVGLICETRSHLPNHDDSIETSTSVRTVSTTKADHSRRIACLCDELYQVLCQHREIQFFLMEQYPGCSFGCYVFFRENGGPYKPRTYQDLFQRISRAGITSANYLTPLPRRLQCNSSKLWTRNQRAKICRLFKMHFMTWKKGSGGKYYDRS